QFYSAVIQQTGASSPFWTIVQGSPPAGVTLSSGGTLSGTPSSSGTFNFTVECDQEGLTSGTQALSLTVNNGGGGITITTMSIPQAFVGVQYDAMVEATGGTPPYAFQLIGEGTPGWLLMASGGIMTGTPDMAGSFTLLVSVRDNLGATNTANLQ